MNILAYGYQIRALREASSRKLLPCVINYRVDAGQLDGKNKVNHPEAKAIVALMRACMEQPEYEGKTFGVISLLGDAQYQLIQKEIDASISPNEIMQRNILCGNSANFQGDERDVIFLSLVDSKDIGNPGPLHLQNYGVDDSTRKRYNVAVSRARDQLWVVHSLDAANDLKPGDIRKKLLDYATNPHALEIAHESGSAASESPFEKAVATAVPRQGLNRTVGISVFPNMVAWNAGPDAFLTPAVFGLVNSAKTCLILEHKAHFSTAPVEIFQFTNGSFNFFEVSMTSSLAFFGCLLRGITFLQP